MTLCKAKEGCEKEAKKLGLCGTHYAQVKRGARDSEGNLLHPLRPRYGGTLCKVLDCKKGAFALGFCNKHYQSFRFNRIDEDGNATDPSTWKNYYNPAREQYSKAGPCKLPGCNHPRVDSETQLCGRHYRQFQIGIIDRDGKSLREPFRVQKYVDTDRCKIEGCNRKPASNWFCKYHSAQHDAGVFDADGKRIRSLSKGGRPKGSFDPSRKYMALGYVLVKAPEGHPSTRKDGYIFEHRLVAESIIGRELQPHEIVHHKDGNRSNNDPANLEVHPRKTHHKAIEYTKDGIKAALSALCHNDPESYNQLVSELKEKKS